MMAGHILVMNVISPLLAASLTVRPRALPCWLGRGDVLAAAGGLQIVVLWSVHAPPLVGHLSAATHVLVQGILFASALFFWSAVFLQDGPHRWRGVLVLLVTGKLFCLLGVLLVFAPRLLYAPLAHGPAALSPTLADQQFAGLLMVVACPSSYVLAAIVIASRWLSDISRTMPDPIACTMGDR
jgi:putative membrane protein